MRVRTVFVFAGVAALAAACSLFFDRERYENGSRADTDASEDAVGEGGPNLCSADLRSDPRNCGGCEHDCVAGECRDGLCESQLLASDTPTPRALVVSNGRLYWIETYVGIKSSDLTGGTVQKRPFEVVQPAQVGVGLSVNAMTAYAIVEIGASGGSLFSVPIADLATDGVVPRRATSSNPNLPYASVTVDDSSVYLTAAKLRNPTEPGVIIKLPLDLSDDGGISYYYYDPVVNPFKVVLGGDRAFFTARYGMAGGPTLLDTVLSKAKDASAEAAASIVTSQENILGNPRLVDGDVYWYSIDRGGVIRRTRDNGLGAPEDFVVMGSLNQILASDDERLFWVTVEGSPPTSLSLWGCRVRACNPLRLARLGPAVLADVADLPGAKLGPSLAAEGGWLYWTEPGTNRVQRVSARMR